MEEKLHKIFRELEEIKDKIPEWSIALLMIIGMSTCGQMESVKSELRTTNHYLQQLVKQTQQKDTASHKPEPIK